MGSAALKSAKDLIDENPPETLDEIARLKRALSRKVRNEHVIMLAVKDALKDLPPIIAPPYIPKVSKAVGVEAAILHISDTQIGKVTRTYDIATAERRILLAGEKSLKITELRRNSARIDECYLFLNGDIVEGETIYPGQWWDIECGAAEQATRHAPRILSRLISLLVQGFKKVRITCVPGNHGRVGLPKQGGNPRTNWDRVAFETTALHIASLKDRVTFQVADDFYSIVPILGRNHMVTHGHEGLGSGNDYAITRAIGGWSGSIDEDFTYLHIAHFHRGRMLTVNKRYAFTNGSTESHNDYALSKMNAASDPMQLLLFSDRERGVIAIHQLWLDDTRKR